MNVDTIGFGAFLALSILVIAASAARR